jgi:hypothetical protein
VPRMSATIGGHGASIDTQSDRAPLADERTNQVLSLLAGLLYVGK